MSEKKREQAERLFDAMSGIDPELLARSEKEKKVVPFQKYARISKVIAACLAMFLIGGTCYVTLLNGGKKEAMDTNAIAMEQQDSAKKGKSSSNAPQADMATMDDAGAEENAAWREESYEMVQEAAEGESDDMVKENAAASTNSYSANLDDIHATDKAGAKLEDNEDATSSKRQIRSEELLLKGKFALNNSTSNGLGDQQLCITLPSGEAKLVGNTMIAEQLYAYVQNMLLEETRTKEFTSYVEIDVLNSENEVTKTIKFSGDYLKYEGDDATFEILDEDYDYASFVEGLEGLLWGE